MVDSQELDTVWVGRIMECIQGLRYGSVQIVVHDGKIVQIDRMERKRYESPATNPDKQAHK